MDKQLTLDSGPLYQRVRAQILGELRAGLFEDGKALPSEQRLAKTYAVSQGTVRKAIDDLVAQNILVRHQGRGTFLRKHDENASLFRFFRLSRPDGSRPYPESRMLSAKVIVGRKEPCERLGLKRGTKLIEIRRVRDIDNEPAIFEIILVAQSRFKGLDKMDLPNTLYKLYTDEFGVNITRAQEQVGCVELEDRVADYLKLQPGAFGLSIQRVAYGLNDQPVELRVSLCRSDRLVYSSLLS